MFKLTCFALLVLVFTQIVHTFSTSQVDIGDHGYRKVAEGSISHCGTNTAQQCLIFETRLTGVNITNDGNLDIACTPSGKCVFPFDFETQSANVTVNCLDLQGKQHNSTVNAHFGKIDVTPNGVEYASFTVYGDDVSAKWESDQYYTPWLAVSVYVCFYIVLIVNHLSPYTYIVELFSLFFKESRNSLC